MDCSSQDVSSDLLGLDRYQENTRTLGVLVQISDKFIVWNQIINDLSTRMNTGLLGFNDLDPLIQQIMKDMNQTVQKVWSEKNKFRQECKKVREAIKSAPSSLGPYSNPEPPTVPSDRPKKIRKRKIKKEHPEEAPEVKEQEDLLAKYLEEHPLQ